MMNTFFKYLLSLSILKYLERKWLTFKETVSEALKYAIFSNSK